MEDFNEWEIMNQNSVAKGLVKTTDIKEENKDSRDGQPKIPNVQIKSEKIQSPLFITPSNKISSSQKFDTKKTTNTTNTNVETDKKNVKSETENKLKTEAERVEFTEDECKAIDSWLVDDFFNKLRSESAVPSNLGGICTVKFGPIELSDLADPSLQSFIASRPNCNFFFKKQSGKFKKKKGHAECNFANIISVRALINDLLPLKLMEKTLDVSISEAVKGKEHKASFQIKLQNASKVLQLVNDPPNMTANRPQCSQIIENVPDSTPDFFLKTIFLLSKRVSKLQEKDEYELIYPNKDYLLAAFQIMSNIAIDGVPIRIPEERQKEVVKPIENSPVKEAISLKRQHSETTVNKVAEKIKSPVEPMEKKKKPEKTEKQSVSPALEHKDEDNDSVSNMTRNVCEGMMESINKLKQLEGNNPNLQKILQMQEELAKLTQSLSSPLTDSDNPWEIGIDDKIANKNEETDSKDDELNPIEKMIVDANRAEVEQEELIKKQRKLEEQQRKELEEKRRNMYNRRMIQDAKESRDKLANVGVKKEAEKLLKAREMRLKEQEQEAAELTSKNTSKATNVSPSTENTSKQADNILKSENSKPVTNRQMINGVPVYSEEEFNEISTQGQANAIPNNYFIQLKFSENRQCPVASCSRTRYFTTSSSFVDHWTLFHIPEVKMKFCDLCMAYFMQSKELEQHLKNRHGMKSNEIGDLVKDARMKVVKNPSFKDPNPYLPPLY